ncbi:MAG: site-2 protease family protein [Candidatus Krumholzibacteriota bacterium]|nr:site-2 protease family protein [Candidatus Krumholzibacteriota bacterium]
MFLTIVAFLFVLSVVVFIHEFGHFIVAKLNNVYVVTFSLGFGPKLLKKRWGETEYAISVIPFGGYCKFAGENDEEDENDEKEYGGESKEADIEYDVPEERTFRAKSPFQKMQIVVAGPLMNALLGLLIYIGSVWAQGVPIENRVGIVGDVKENSPAMIAGFERGDRILEVDGEDFRAGTDLSYLVKNNKDNKMVFKVLRRGDTLSIDVTPEFNGETGEYRLGLSYYLRFPPKIGDVKRDSPAWEAGIRPGAYIQTINDTSIISFTDLTDKIHNSLGRKLEFVWIQSGAKQSAVIIPESIDIPKGSGEKLEVIEAGGIGIGQYYEVREISFFNAVVRGSGAYGRMTVAILGFLKKLVTGNASMKALGGPIRIGQMAGDMARWGFGRLSLFIAFFSLNLAIFNLLPILPFDGGHFVLYLVELVSGRPVNPKVKNVMMQAGFVILIILMVLITAMDLFNVFN